MQKKASLQRQMESNCAEICTRQGVGRSHLLPCKRWRKANSRFWLRAWLGHPRAYKARCERQHSLAGSISHASLSCRFCVCMPSVDCLHLQLISMCLWQASSRNCCDPSPPASLCKPASSPELISCMSLVITDCCCDERWRCSFSDTVMISTSTKEFQILEPFLTLESALQPRLTRLFCKSQRWRSRPAGPTDCRTGRQPPSECKAGQQASTMESRPVGLDEVYRRP